MLHAGGKENSDTSCLLSTPSLLSTHFDALAPSIRPPSVGNHTQQSPPSTACESQPPLPAPAARSPFPYPVTPQVFHYNHVTRSSERWPTHSDGRALTLPAALQQISAALRFVRHEDHRSLQLLNATLLHRRQRCVRHPSHAHDHALALQGGDSAVCGINPMTHDDAIARSAMVRSSCALVTVLACRLTGTSRKHFTTAMVKYRLARAVAQRVFGGIGRNVQVRRLLRFEQPSHSIALTNPCCS
jgi:hypothetical protein